MLEAGLELLQRVEQVVLGMVVHCVSASGTENIASELTVWAEGALVLEVQIERAALAVREAAGELESTEQVVPLAEEGEEAQEALAYFGLEVQVEEEAELGVVLECFWQVDQGVGVGVQGAGPGCSD